MAYDNWLDRPYQEQMRTEDRFEDMLRANRETLEIEYLEEKGLDKIDSEKNFRQWCALNWEDSE